MNLVPALSALLVFALTSLPGWLLAARAKLSLAPFLAAGFASTFAVLNGTALLSVLTGYLPAWSALVIAAISCAVIWRQGRGSAFKLPSCSPVVVLVPLLMILHACLIYRVGFGIDQHPAIFRAYYNADWFKHLGHVHSLSNFGLPAKDIFGGGARLHYYWLFYILPAASASLHGDPSSALFFTNIVLIFFFWFMVVAYFQKLGLSDRAAAGVALCGWAIFTMDGFLQMPALLSDPWSHITSSFKSSGLLSALNSFIPQHLLMMAGLLSFGLLWSDARSRSIAPLFWLALAPVIAAGATSILLGATVVATACLTILLTCSGSFVSRLALAGAVGTTSIGIVLVLQIVDLSFGVDSIASPAFGGDIDQRSPLEGILLGILIQFVLLGLALPLGIWGLAHGLRHATSERPLIMFSILMLGVAMLVLIGSQGFLDNLRMVGELRYRNAYPVCLALLAGLAVLIRDLESFGRSRRSVVALLGLMLLLAFPSNILNFLWQGWADKRWQVIVPDADMRTLGWLGEHSAVDALVLQFPEPIYLMDKGRDTWVPIFAGRTIFASYRDTDWSKGQSRVDLAQRFYEGKLTSVPPEIDWVYLSRTLHPATYDALRHRLSQGEAWRRAYCEMDACLFRKAVRKRAQ